MAPASASKALGQWLERSDLTIEALASTTSELLPAIAPRQTRYKVTERPDVRTIRYYTSQGLLPKPVSYEGGRARYSGSHLLRLLLIKRMQAEHQTLHRIKRVLRGASDEEIVRQLGSAVEPEPPTKPSARSNARRLSLSPGGTLEVPRDVLSDPTRRAALADNLEALADWLRSSGDGPDRQGE